MLRKKTEKQIYPLSLYRYLGRIWGYKKLRTIMCTFSINFRPKRGHLFSLMPHMSRENEVILFQLYSCIIVVFVRTDYSFVLDCSLIPNPEYYTFIYAHLVILAVNLTISSIRILLIIIIVLTRMSVQYLFQKH